MNFVIPVDHRLKIKESKKIDKYLDLARELKVLQNMNVMMISVVVGAFGTVPNGLEKRLGNRRSKVDLEIQTDL